jgi:hypothetical protein
MNTFLKKGGVRMNLFKNRSGAIKGAMVILTLAFVIASVSYIIPALAVHTSTVTIDPFIVAGLIDDQSFEVEVCNDAPSTHDIHEFRIYYEWADFIEFTDVSCQSKTGWSLYIIDTIWGKACLYSSQASANNIKPGECDYFYFTADTPEEDCCRELRFETRDEENSWMFHDVNVCVDALDPITTKEFIGPQKIENGVEWIDGVTLVNLTAIDPQPHPSNVSKTYYYNMLSASDEPCWSTSVCNEYRLKHPLPLYDFTEYVDPFPKEGESCHILWYYSIDNVGNVEDVKVNCFFVDTAPPEVHKEVDEDAIPDRDESYPIEGSFHWITPDMDIEFWCDDPEPHPSEDEELCFRVSYDQPSYPTYLTTDYCTKYGGVMKLNYFGDGVDWCCVDATPQNHFIFNFNEDEDSIHDLEYFCVDAVMKHTEPEIQYYKVDSKPPILIDKLIIGPYYAVEGTCPPSSGADICHLDGESTIEIYVEDGGDTCVVDEVWCRWGYTLDGGDFYGWYEAFPIWFPEETKHDLVIECYDKLGNKMVDEETFYVDKTAPETKKTYIGSQYPVAVAHPTHITSETEVHLDATDDVGPHDSGVAATYYRDVYLDNPEGWHYCEYDCETWAPQRPKNPLDPTSEGWTLYTEHFHKTPESCHIIEYYSIDNVDKVEDIKWQCVFVDDTAPTLLEKQVGEPKVEKDGKIYISGETDITMRCEDQGPHPVNDVSLWYRYRISDDCATWGDWLTDGCEGDVVDGWCDPTGNGQVVEKTINFPQDSCHELEYYCEDALGNEATHEFEIDVVDNQPPVIVKEVVGPQLECPPQEPQEPFACERWACLEGGEKDFFVTGRSDPSNWDLAIWNGNPEQIEDQDEYTWVNGGDPVPFSVEYDADTGEITYIVDGKELSWIYDSEKAFGFIVIMAKGNEGGDMSLTGVEVNGESVGDIISSANYQGLRVPLTDAEQVDGFKVSGYAAMDWESKTTQEIPGMHVFAMNTHDPVEDCYQIDGVTEIQVDSYDPEPHPSNEVLCAWKYTVINNGGGGGQQEVTPPFVIKFPEESAHILTITCWDALGNSVTDVEMFIVDKTPPETTKTYEGPQYPLAVAHPTHINSETLIYLDATDDVGPHDSGVAATYWRNQIVDNMNCEEPEKSCFPIHVHEDDGWNEYTGPFQKGKESCHMIEYWSVDNVDKKEPVKAQCVFVDNSPPKPVKTVGEPKAKWNITEEPSYFYPEETAHCWDGTGDEIDCWKVTMMTPITLDCVDPEPHPVDHEEVCFMVDLDGCDETETYCDYYSGEYNESGNGYCCVDHVIEDFTFKEETEHNLKYYCVDALGNSNEQDVDEEKFKVEGTNFEIPLFKKWNLISVPFVLLDDNPEVVFNNTKEYIDSVWAYDPDEEMCTGGSWCVWTPGDGPDDLKVLPGWGYWVLLTDKPEGCEENGNECWWPDEEPLWLVIGGSLFNTGPVIPPDKSLVKGWNLIGYYGTSWELYDWSDNDFVCGDSFNFPDRWLYGDKVYCALNSLIDTQEGYPRWSSVWSYINCGDHVDAWLGLNACADRSLQQLLDRMYAGRGYWIEIDVPDLYSPATTCIWNDDFECRWTGGGIII